MSELQRLRRGFGRRLNTGRGLARWWVGRDRESRIRLRAMSGMHAGERCFLFGNGPSLNETDLGALGEELTFGLNRIYLKFAEIGYETDYLACINGHVLRQFAADFEGLGSTRFLASGPNPRFEPSERLLLIPTVHPVGFATDPSRRGVHEGGTVTFAALQLAYLMGFAEVVLVGVDHRFTTPGPANLLVTAGARDVDHFDPGYFGPGVEWQLPDLEASERSYRIARKAFEDDGRRIIDATVGGALEVFPKVDFDRLVG